MLALDGQFTDSTNITINVIDENDNAPIFNVTLPFEIRIPEESTGVYDIAQITATDEDAPPNNQVHPWLYYVNSEFTLVCRGMLN